MMSDTSLQRLARSRPVLFALYETLLTGGCALFWSAVAGLLYLENAAHDPWDPDYPPARQFFLLACVSALSLPVTWLLKAFRSRGCGGSWTGRSWRGPSRPSWCAPRRSPT